MDFNYSIHILKSTISIREVVESCGFELNRQNAICCPFHSEKTPSLKIYDKTNTFYCFGCGTSGDIITFYSKYYCLPFKQALERLASDFNVNLPDYAPRVTLKQRKEQLQKYKDFLSEMKGGQ